MTDNVAVGGQPSHLTESGRLLAANNRGQAAAHGRLLPLPTPVNQPAPALFFDEPAVRAPALAGHGELGARAQLASRPAAVVSSVAQKVRGVEALDVLGQHHRGPRSRHSACRRDLSTSVAFIKIRSTNPNPSPPETGAGGSIS
jgi:hypothetical protein